MLTQVLKVLEGHTDWVFAVAISADGANIISVSGDKTVRIWSAATGEVHTCMSVITRCLASLLLSCLLYG